MGKGTVSLVGAGPGDTGLLTLRAQELLSAADMVVYDYLVNPAHLRHAKKGAKFICVGKGFRHKRLSQERINRLIVGASKKGLEVVRLKGGDPYLFGRGGEEALFLVKHKLPFRVVPGVTSATACAAYAGIPLTHREHNSTVTFLTGHKADDDALDFIRWKNVVSIGGTLVIYMGFYNIRKICLQLQRHGMAAATPVCVIEWGTLPRQRTCSGTLATIASRVARQALRPPCLIIVGDVVSLRDKLGWYEKQPLFGKRVVVTRMAEKAGELRARFEHLGAGVTELPVIQIRAAKRLAPMDGAIRTLRKHDWVVFMSAYGVEIFMERMKNAHGLDARAFHGIKIAAVGPGTAAALEKKGLNADVVPRRFEAKALVEAIRGRVKELRGKTLLLVRSSLGPVFLETEFRRMGASTVRVDAYEARPNTDVARRMKREMAAAAPDFVTFASASSAHFFARLAGRPLLNRLSKKTRFVSIGPVTSKAMREEGLRVHAEARPYTFDGLVEAVKRCAGGKR